MDDGGLVTGQTVPAGTRDDGGVSTSTRGRLTHDADGALGLVLNRPVDLPMAEIFPDWVEVAAPPACMYFGGPVEPEAALGLGEGPADRDQMIVGLVGAVDLEGRPEDYRAVRIFAGYSGWAPGQLDGELARGDWIVVDARVEDVTGTAPSNLWRDVLRRSRHHQNGLF